MKYIKKIDYLRVLALFGVLFFHLTEEYVKSGYLAVNLFFVLAGFLSMYDIKDREKKASIFLVIRKILLKIQKIILPMLIVIFIVSIIMILFFNNFLQTYPYEAVSSTLFFNNYFLMLGKESYFEAMNSLKPLTHLWALSLEMQFYIMFFLIIFKTYKRGNCKYYIIFFAVLALLSIILNFIFLQTDKSINFMYYDFFLRSYAFLMGAFTALLTEKKCNNKGPNYNIIYILLFFVMFVLFFINADTDVLKILFMILFAVIGSIICFLFTIDNKEVNMKFYPYIHFLSKRSLYIYLIHYPVIVFLNRIFAHKIINYFIYILLNLVIIFVLSEFLYMIIDIINKIKMSMYAKFVATIAFVVLNVVFAYSMKLQNDKATFAYESNANEIYIETTESVVSNEETFETSENVVEKNDYIIETTDATNDESVALNGEVKHYKYEDFNLNELPRTISVDDVADMHLKEMLIYIDQINQYLGESIYVSKETFLNNFSRSITIIGDSVAVCSKNCIMNYFTGGTLNAKSLREFEDSYPIILDMKSNNTLSDIVVLALGTNASHGINKDILEIIYNELEGRKLILCTIVLPHKGVETERNNILREFANSHNNCYLADWYGVAKTHPEFFQDDNIHPLGVGGNVYAQIIFKTMAEISK